MEYKKISSFELLRYGVKTFIDNILLFLSVPFVIIGMLGIVTMIFAGISFLVNPAQFETLKTVLMSSQSNAMLIIKQMPTSSLIVWAFFLAAILYVMYGILYGLIKIILSIYDRKPATIVMLTAYFGRALSLFFTYVIFYSAVAFGLTLFIIPGIYIATRCLFAPYILVDKNCGIIDAFKMAFELSRGRFLIIFAVLVISTLLMAIPVANIAGAFIVMIMHATLYQQVRDQRA